MDEAFGYFRTLMACADSAVYVLDGAGHVLTEYKRGAAPRLVAMPEEVVEAARVVVGSSSESHFMPGYIKLFLAVDGRLVIMTNTAGIRGAVMDRATGCYALLKDRFHWGGGSYVGMFGDSVVTLEGSRQPTTEIVDGKLRRVFITEKSHIFVRPVRPASGEPCS